jgi:hypothetical protein
MNAEFEIVRGEVGFDVMKNGRVWQTGFAWRAYAATAIRNDIKHDEALIRARKAVHKLRVSLAEDYGLTAREIEEVLGGTSTP